MVLNGLGGPGLFAASLLPAGLSFLLLESSLGGIGLVAVGDGGAGLPGWDVSESCLLPFQPSFLRKLDSNLSGIGLHETGLPGTGLGGS